MVQFVSSNSSSNYTTNGFTFFGSFAFYVDSSGAYQSLWHAKNATEDGVYYLKWGAEADDSSVPIALKTTAPGDLASTNRTVV
jgi:hypothetical protein